MSKVSIAPGDRFGRLVTVEESRRGRHRSWICRCDCGVTANVVTYHLVHGETVSCGCARRDRFREPINRTHGKSHSRVWRIWCCMRGRCERSTSNRFKDYGGRGIRVCSRWQSFDSFFADMGDPPSERHSIDRINNDGNYEPGNCRWALPSDQASNRRKPAQKERV